MAVKSVPPTYLQEALNELKMLRLLNNQNESAENPNPLPSPSPSLKLIGFHRTTNTLQIVTEYFGESLTRIMTTMEPNDLEYVLQIFQAILMAM